MSRGEGEGMILALLQDTHEAMAPDQIAQETGLTDNEVRRTLGKMARDRTIVRAGGGKFTAAAEKFKRRRRNDEDEV